MYTLPHILTFSMFLTTYAFCEKQGILRKVALVI